MGNYYDHVRITLFVASRENCYYKCDKIYDWVIGLAGIYGFSLITLLHKWLEKSKITKHAISKLDIPKGVWDLIWIPLLCFLGLYLSGTLAIKLLIFLKGQESLQANPDAEEQRPRIKKWLKGHTVGNMSILCSGWVFTGIFRAFHNWSFLSPELAKWLESTFGSGTPAIYLGIFCGISISYLLVLSLARLRYLAPEPDTHLKHFRRTCLISFLSTYGVLTSIWLCSEWDFAHFLFRPLVILCGGVFGFIVGTVLFRFTS